MQKAMNNSKAEFLPELFSTWSVAQVRSLFSIWAGILEDAHVLTLQNPYCICIQSKIGLLHLTNSVCPSSSNLGLFLRNTLSLIIHPALIVYHVCRGCWWGRGCWTMHKGEGHSPHQHYCSSEQAQKHNRTPSVSSHYNFQGEYHSSSANLASTIASETLLK